MSKENIQKAIEEKIAAAQLLAQEYPQYITAEKTKTLEKMVAIFQKMIVKPIMSASMPQGEMGVSAMMDVNPGDIQKLVGNMEKKLSDDLKNLIHNTKYIKLSQNQYEDISAYITIGENTDFTFTKNHLSSLINDLKKLIQVDVCIKIIYVQNVFVNHYKNIKEAFEKLYSVTDKEKKQIAKKDSKDLNDAEKLFKKEDNDFIDAIGNIVAGLVSNFQTLLDNCTRLTQIIKFEDWSDVVSRQLGSLLNNFEKVKNQEEEPQSVDGAELKPSPYTRIKINEALLDGIKYSIEKETSQDISAYLTNNITVQDTYFEVIYKVSKNFENFCKLGEQDSKILEIKKLLEKGKDIDLYEIVISYIAIPEAQKIPDTIIKNVNNNSNNNEAHGGKGGNATVENPKEPTPEKKDKKSQGDSTYNLDGTLNTGDNITNYNLHLEQKSEYIDNQIIKIKQKLKQEVKVDLYDVSFLLPSNYCSISVKLIIDKDGNIYDGRAIAFGLNGFDFICEIIPTRNNYFNMIVEATLTYKERYEATGPSEKSKHDFGIDFAIGAVIPLWKFVKIAANFSTGYNYTNEKDSGQEKIETERTVKHQMLFNLKGNISVSNCNAKELSVELMNIEHPFGNSLSPFTIRL